jgi:hypothetical protein
VLTWSYYSWVVKVPNVRHLDDGLNRLGAEGWELVTSLSTVKSWVNVTGNDIVLMFKKPGDRQAPSGETLNFLANGDAPAY